MTNEAVNEAEIGVKIQGGTILILLKYVSWDCTTVQMTATYFKIYIPH